MTELNAAQAGEFTFGSDITVHRLGFGAMRLTGRGIWGEPEDPQECLRVLRRLPELGVNFIDTADAYGPYVSETLIREALHPYDGLMIATKGGLVRAGPDQWIPVGRPEYLRQSILMSCGASASTGSICGNCTGSIRKYRAMSNSMRSADS
jgi:pyridoxine 4-dehydrogenase